MAVTRRTSIRLPAVCTPSVVVAVIASGLSAHAQAPPQDTTVRLKYVHYRDFQAGGEDRMRVGSPMLWAKGPIGTSNDFEVGAVADSMSGASPLYLDTLSGASAVGIRDDRYAGDVRFTHYEESYSVAAGGVVSDEDDYLSRSANFEVKSWSDDKNTVVSLGASSDWDVITSTNNPELEETRRTNQLQLGVTQVLSPSAIMQSNLMFSSGNGYFSDPYKLFENRPRSRDVFAWLTRFNYFIEELESSLHFDYRLFHDTWGVTSHTLEARYYQPLAHGITLVPIARYYSQNGASFFFSDVSNPPLERFSTADQRLSDFGAVTAGVKIIAQLSERFSLDALYQRIEQSSRFSFGGSDGIKDFGAHYLEVGLAVRF